MVKKEQQELSEEAVARITRVIRSLAEDRVDRGVELSRPMQCDNCAQEKASAGSALYGAYKFCNDCLLDFTVALAGGQVQNIADFMTRKTEDYGAPPTSDVAQRERLSVSRPPLSARDKLMPSNEPI